MGTMTLRAVFLTLFVALAAFSPAPAQIAPNTSELQTYRGLHAAAAAGDVADIERLAKSGAAIMRATATRARRCTSLFFWASRMPRAS